MQRPAVPCFVAVAAFVAAMAFAIALQPTLGFAGPPPPAVVVIGTLMLVFHFAMMLVIAAVPAPEWAKASGYVWAVGDNALIVLSLFGGSAEVVVPLRWGLHLGTATWIFAASVRRDDAARPVGILAAIAFAVVTMVGPFLSAADVQRSIGPAGVLLVAWLIMLGLRLRKPAASGGR